MRTTVVHLLSEGEIAQGYTSTNLEGLDMTLGSPVAEHMPLICTYPLTAKLLLFITC
jgi:hypothetical protein